jgi:hypothetical protein
MNIGSIEQYAQLGASVTVVIVFISYLKTRDGEFTKAITMFNKTINEYLKNSIKTQKELAKKLQLFADTNHEQSQTIRELKDVTEKMYELQVKKKLPKLYEEIKRDHK